MSTEYFPLADLVEHSDRERLGLMEIDDRWLTFGGDDVGIPTTGDAYFKPVSGLSLLAKRTDETRSPRAGEWYLAIESVSGNHTARKARIGINDDTLQILELVIVRTVVTVREVPGRAAEHGGKEAR